jgi:hypothetical protein
LHISQTAEVWISTISIAFCAMVKLAASTVMAMIINFFISVYFNLYRNPK